MFIDFVYFVPGLKVGFPGIFLDWNPEMSHFRKFQPERSSGILLLDPALNRHFPSRTSSEGLDGEWTPLVMPLDSKLAPKFSRMSLKIKKRLGLLSSNFFSVAPAGPESTPPEPLTHQLYGKINIEPGDAV